MGHRRLSSLALAVGVVDGLLFLVFEWVVKHGTDWLWNDVVDSDDVRWRVVPLALVLSIALSALLRWLDEPRWTPPHVDPLGAAEEPGAPPPSAGAVGTILAIGAVGLLAGASLGPEAPLLAAAVALGAWVSTRADATAVRAVLVLASAGALLVAFFGSLIALAIPLLILRQRTGRSALAPVVAIALAGLAAWLTVWLLQGNHHGYGTIPSAGVEAHDYAIAVLLGLVAVGIGTLLRWFVTRLNVVTEQIRDGTPWWLAATIFGVVLGALYLVGGETAQFSGSGGSMMLLSGEVHYGPWALAGVALVKLAATSWSVASGYRGGLVFPAVFAGVAVSLLTADTLPDLAGPGVLLGAIAGLLVEMTAPMLGVVMLLALVPVELLPLALAGAAGAIVARMLLTRPAPTGELAPAGSHAAVEGHHLAARGDQVETADKPR
ncbi:MAG TPA: chloride channel protein [Baekduia sp.]|nr:chloride channel protein [Baekduia sp.]